jgi:hypothetical protein
VRHLPVAPFVPSAALQLSASLHHHKQIPSRIPSPLHITVFYLCALCRSRSLRFSTLRSESFLSENCRHGLAVSSAPVFTASAAWRVSAVGISVLPITRTVTDDHPHRMFQEPDEAIAHDAAAKLDRAAALHRSTIRRQPTVRPSRYNPDALSARLRAAEERHRSTSRRREDAELNTELQISQLEAEIARLRSRRGDITSRVLREAENAVQSMRDTEAMMQQMSGTSSSTRDHESDDQTDSLRRRFHLSRPNRESSLRFEVNESSRSRQSPTLNVSAPRSPDARPHRWITPPSSSGSGRNVPDGPVPAEQGTPAALTQGFAPARYHGDDLRSPETPPPETWESSLPPLVSWTRRPERLSQRSIDGLGDRHRSPSTDRSGEEENWQNLLTTLESRQSGSTATSFASNHDSGSQSRNSQSTVATSFGEIPADDGCDLDLPPGINEEIAREIREQHRSRDRQRRRNGEPDGPVMTGEQGYRMHQARMRRARGDGGIDSRQVQRIQEIMERFSSREEVPDDWWTVMGWDEDAASEAPRERSRTERPRSPPRFRYVDGALTGYDTRPRINGRLVSYNTGRPTYSRTPSEERGERPSRMLDTADEVMQRLRDQGELQSQESENHAEATARRVMAMARAEGFSEQII